MIFGKIRIPLFSIGKIISFLLRILPQNDSVYSDENKYNSRRKKKAIVLQVHRQYQGFDWTILQHLAISEFQFFIRQLVLQKEKQMF